ncbi:MAG: hypothetical protein ABIK62_01680 [candidate division WOR-3 bacterium]
MALIQAPAHDTEETKDARSARVSARINLAGTEVQQGKYSEVPLHQAIALLPEGMGDA